jgi:hypothetical protein
VFKSLLGFTQAAILVGMSGIAPYAAVPCARHGSGDAMAPMRGMEHGPAGRAVPAGGSARAGHNDGAPVRDAELPAQGTSPGRSSAPHRHSCCGCLGPCASGGAIALQAARSAGIVDPLGAATSATAFVAGVRSDSPRLLPFPNAPPPRLG